MGGARGKDAAGTRAPSIAVVFLQPHCNMTCTFCVTEDGFEVMDFGLAVGLLDRLVEAGVRTVVLGGGEPFAWRGDVVALAREAKARGLFVQVGTNGIALPDDFASIEWIDRYVLPLESAEDRVHDAMRAHRCGHHGLILARLAELRARRRSVTVSTVITATNVDGVLDLAAWLRAYVGQGGNLHAWHLYQFLPLGRGGRRNASDLSIPEDDYRQLCETVRAMDLPFTVFQRTDMYDPRVIEFFWQESGVVIGGAEMLR